MRLITLLKPNTRIIVLCLLALGTQSGHAFQLTNNTSPLHPSEAFKVLASFTDTNTVRIEYSIAEGYYLYHSRFKFDNDSPEYILGKPIFSETQTVQDEYFGPVETYSYHAFIEIPVQQQPSTSTGSTATPLKLQVTSQGCASEAGICYQPYIHTLELTPSL